MLSTPDPEFVSQRRIQSQSAGGFTETAARPKRATAAVSFLCDYFFSTFSTNRTDCANALSAWPNELQVLFLDAECERNLAAFRIGDVVVEPPHGHVAVLAFHGYPHNPQVRSLRESATSTTSPNLSPSAFRTISWNCAALGSFATLTCGCGETLQRPMS